MGILAFIIGAIAFIHDEFSYMWTMVNIFYTYISKIYIWCDDIACNSYYSINLYFECKDIGEEIINSLKIGDKYGRYNINNIYFIAHDCWYIVTYIFIGFLIEKIRYIIYDKFSK